MNGMFSKATTMLGAVALLSGVGAGTATAADRPSGAATAAKPTGTH
ncbi:hypothetical protein [Actinomadura sp. KC345]|nr:hypothetical protein [Actinomadura sp. KC345]